MIRKIERRWFEVWGNEVAQNQFLKGLLALLIVLLVIESFVLLILALRKPVLIAVTPTQSAVLKVEPPSKDLLESEVLRITNDYVTKHHNWDWQHIDQTQNEAAEMVASSFQKTFFRANAEQIRIAKDKRLSQRFYVQEITADFSSKTVKVTGDRILLVDALRATNPLRLEISYDFGARTESNPSGIYVTAEKLISDK